MRFDELTDAEYDRLLQEHDQIAAWSEACRMFSDESVCSAVIKIAELLKGSNALYKTSMTVSSVATKSVPDGWRWSGPFAD
jgi:hypothetical protein